MEPRLFFSLAIGDGTAVPTENIKMCVKSFPVGVKEYLFKILFSQFYCTCRLAVDFPLVSPPLNLAPVAVSPRYVSRPMETLSSECEIVLYDRLARNLRLFVC